MIHGLGDEDNDDIPNMANDKYFMAKFSSQAVIDVVAERKRQVTEEGWTPAHDDQHRDGAMARAAATYAYAAFLAPNERKWHRDSLFGVVSGCFSVVAALWPWDAHWFKPKNPRRDLVKAGALILAEIERIDREANISKTQAA